MVGCDLFITINSNISEGSYQIKRPDRFMSPHNLIANYTAAWCNIMQYPLAAVGK